MNYETLKAAVADVIKTNGNEEITGQLLQDVLIAIINALGSGYQFMGIATAETTPGTPDQRVFYLAGSAGSTVLPGFGITVDHEICVLMYSDEWEKQTLLQFDSVLTSGSQNLVTSGMVYDALTNLSQAIDGLAEIVGGHTTAIESLEETVGGHTTAIDDLQYAVVAIQAAIESLQTDVAQKIDKSDADSLVVGSAQGILATSAVEAFFLFQQSGATGDGAALIPTIKGKTIAWNQLRETPSYTNTQVDTRPFFDLRIMGCDSPTISLNPVYYVTEEVTTKGRRVYVFTASRPYLIIKHNGAIQDLYMLTNMPTISGHKYFLSFDMTGIDPTTAGGLAFDNAMLTDLTILGLGDLTAVQFETFYNKLYYSPIPGVLKNNDAVAMITNGFNQWDEVAEPGGINSADGQNSASTTTGRSKNYIPVFGGTTYYAKTTQRMYTRYYDASQNYIGYLSKDNKGSVLNEAFTTPDNCAYMRFVCDTIIADNSICINLSNPAKNGTYEPYWSRTSNFGLTGITGIPEGGTEDDRVTIFPDGLAGVGSAFDSIFVENGVTKAKKMMARVNLGVLNWAYDNTYQIFYFMFVGSLPINPTSMAQGAKTGDLVINSKYALSELSINHSDPEFASGPDKTLAIQRNLFTSFTSAWFQVKDTAYADAAAFKAAMSGVMLEYELATPIVYTNLQYANGTPFTMPQMFRTAQGGTMLIVSPEGATEPSAPFSADIIYPVDPIASSGASLKNLLEALKTATVITSYTMTFNSTTQQYEFTITK